MSKYSFINILKRKVEQLTICVDKMEDIDKQINDDMKHINSLRSELSKIKEKNNPSNTLEVDKKIQEYSNHISNLKEIKKTENLVHFNKYVLTHTKLLIEEYNKNDKIKIFIDSYDKWIETLCVEFNLTVDINARYDYEHNKVEFERVILSRNNKVLTFKTWTEDSNIEFIRPGKATISRIDILEIDYEGENKYIPLTNIIYNFFDHVEKSRIFIDKTFVLDGKVKLLGLFLKLNHKEEYVGLFTRNTLNSKPYFEEYPHIYDDVDYDDHTFHIEKSNHGDYRDKKNNIYLEITTEPFA